MNQELNEISINGVEYVRKDSVKTTPKLNKDNASIVRTVSAGVFFGYPSSMDLAKGLVTLKNVRRLWYWSGAASLSQLAVDGTSKPSECKFPTEVEEIQLTNVIEVIKCTEKAVDSLTSVKIWNE